MSPIKGKYLVDSQGHPKAVVINLREYKRLMRIIEDLRDVKFIHRRQNEKLIPMEEVHRRLRK